jgi:hypothetical protein
MILASISPKDRGATDRILTNVVDRLDQEGVKVLGALRDFGQSDEKQHCNSALRLLPDGPVV